MKKIATLLFLLFSLHFLQAQPNIIKAEYFIDNDPGFGNAVNIPVSASVNIINSNFSFSTSSLNNGLHTLNLRSLDANGHWSITNPVFFYKSNLGTLPNIVKAEYFIDSDPGFGNAINIPVSASANINNSSFSFNTNSLNNGYHLLFIRSLDANSHWSITNVVSFNVNNPITTRYYADADSDGYGNISNYTLAGSPPPGYVTDSTDCNDNNAAIHPGAIEIQNSIDDNCDGQVDEGLIGFNQFIFLKGNTTDYRYGSYGVQGVASVSNNPGIRRYQTTWEYNGKVYMFGGEGVATQLSSPGGNPTPPQGYLSDVWEYNPATNNWRWLKSNSSLGGAAVYGTKGVSASTNNPGARKNAMSWTLNNKLYLFGGYNGARLCDLWEYDPATNNWTWIAGNNTLNSLGSYGTMGVADATNFPGGREQAASWTYNGKLYMFGGVRSDGVNDVILNDQWEYNFTTGFWTWVKGTNLTNQFGVYGTKGVPSSTNIPGSKYEAAFTSIGNRFFLFGGAGASASAYGVMDDLWEFDNTTGNWTWIAGSSGTDVLKITGTQGTYAAANTPGSRGGATITSHNNTLYLYGGHTWFLGFHSDLWQYDPSISQWRSVKGNATVNSLGNYGFREVEAATNLPGARGRGSFITTGSHLYLFGGRGYNSVTSTSDESRNDLWKFNTTTNNWTWLNGPSGKERYGEYGTTGVASATNKPGDRVGHGMAALNGKIYMFGGGAKRTYNNESNSNDLWVYDPATNNWKFLKGSSTFELPENYGVQGVPAATNLPGTRTWVTMWSLNNKIYMFGGHRGVFKNDLWEYNPVTNNWTWLKGSSGANQPGIYGTKGIAAAGNIPGGRLQASGFVYNSKLYLFGGEGYNSGTTTGDLNDLWEYDPATNNWTWISGDDAINVAGVYGTIGVPAANNKPGSRMEANTEIINNKLYLFGNLGHGNTVGRKLLNDLWQYDFTTNQWTFIKGSNTGTAAGSTGTLGVEAATNMPGNRTGSSGFTIGNKLYIFGGTPFSNSYNDLWEYNPVTNNWRWMKGPGNSSNQRGNYGLTGIAATANLPPARKQMKTAVIGNTAYLFGGEGQYATNIGENFNFTSDLWKWNGENPINPAATRLYVNDNNLSGDIYTSAIGNDNNPGTPSAPLATLDFAVLMADAGDTIYVDAGTYITPNFTIGKAITILGPNYTIPVNNVNNMLLYNTSRNAEAIINNSTITLGSSNIRIEGLTFDPLSKTQIQQANSSLDFSNIYILRNRFLVSSTLTSINITGRNITPLSSNTYLIVGNRFEKTGGASGNSVTLNAINVAHVSGNAFVVANASLASLQTGISIGTTIKVDNLTIAGNVFDRQNAPVSTTRFGTTLIDDNRAYDNRLGLQLNNSITEPAVITVTRNTFINTLVNGPVQYNRSGGSDASGVNRLIFEDNTVLADATGQTFSALIVPVCQSTVQNSEVFIKKNIITYNGDFSSFTTSAPLAIRPAGKFNVITIDNNEVNFNGINLSPTAGGATPSTGIFIFSNPGTAANAIPSNAVININNNKVSGFKQSVAFYHLQLSQYGGLANGIITNINNNSFIGDIISINNGATSETANGNCNWYGITSAQAVISKVTPATVNYSPWLTNGTDNDPATGFQPVPGSCNGTPVTVALTQATNINCFNQNTGAINITVTGGVSPYNFAWTKAGDPGYAAATEDISGLTAGTYHLVITDANNSVATLDVTLTQPAAALSISLNGNNITCFGNNNGSIAATVTGGTTPYIYQWSNGATASSISGLAPGGYTVVVNDANGCNVSTGYNVLEPALLTVTITGTTAACNGSATATAAGGTTPYTYLWSNGATTSSISNVPAGLYTITVTDANGCTANGTYTITGNSNINPSTAIINVSCFGTATGSITVTGAGGVAPHTYNINGSPFQAINMFSNLPAGVYVVGVKDANGCSDFVSKTITQPPLLTVVLDSVRSACFGVNNGRIDITAGGGSGGKMYNWNGPNGYTSTTQDPNNIAGGTYTLTVTDNKGCTANLLVLVPTWSEIALTESVINIGCRGDNTGAINITVSGGTGNGFSFSWTGPGGFIATTEDISGLIAGNYKITVTDLGSGCTLIKTIAVLQPATNLHISTAKTNVTGCNSLGTITVSGSGGTVPYQYSINGISYQASGSFTGLYAGDFTVWVKDANGCTQTKIVSITDNGEDEYESNNNKNNSKTIGIGSTINARIALGSDPADWFKFTTPVGTGNYILSLTHPSAVFTFDMYAAGNNTPALVPVATTATTKEYTLAGSTTYYVSVTGGMSYVCYDMMVAPPTTFTRTAIISNPISENNSNDKNGEVSIAIPDVASLSVTAFPNPHQGTLNLRINSPEKGIAKIELFTISGQKLQEKTVSIQKSGISIVPFTVAQYGTILYRISIGDKIITGKILSLN